jgi:transposase
MKRAQRLVSRQVKGSSNRRKARIKLARIYLKISRQRKDHAVKLARCVITSNDVVNILNSGLGTTGHVGTFALDASNASGNRPLS